MRPKTANTFRIQAATGTHKGDRAYQQDQVKIIPHTYTSACLLAVVADGMGGKSGGRKASDQVILTAQQLFERFAVSRDDPQALLKQLLMESHLMIKLTAITAEEEPHSTLAAFLMMPNRVAYAIHAGDSRIYHLRQGQMLSRTLDHSYVQRLVQEGQITEEEANTHPQSNLLTGCLGTEEDPPISSAVIDDLQVGDTLLACTDGLWHYFTPEELAAATTTLSPREACEMLIDKARQRAHGGGDNLSLAIVKLEQGD